MEKRGYHISDIYQGGYSSFKYPKDNYIKTGSLGLSTDPRTANLLQEVSTKLSTGVKHIDVTAVSPEVFDSVPKQQLKEINRLSKLTGIDITMHGPVINVSGINQQGFSEAEREAAEKKIQDALLRSHDLNPDGNIPVNFHSAEGIPGSQLLPPSKRKEGEEYRRLIIVNKDTGRMAPLEPEIEYYPGKEKLEPEPLTPEQRLERLNKTEWDNSLSQLLFNQERAQEILTRNQVQIQHVLESINEMKKQNISDRQISQMLSPEEQQAYSNFLVANDYLGDVTKQINTYFSKAYEFGNEHQKEILKAFSEQFRKDTEENSKNPFAYALAMQKFVHNLKSSQVAPEMYVPVEKFALETSSKTFGNAAFEAYKKYKDKAPILEIENPPAGFALSTGKDIRNMVEESRKQFVKKAVESGISEGEARKQAEKLIGATWDVGHINMLRKYGYSEKEIIEEAKHVAPVLKHVHLSDNFGFEHTELPMGMGNVPFKEIMKQLGKKGFEAKKLIEAGNWWQHFRTPPFQETLEATGSPVYSMKMAPYWAQAPGLYQGYFSGYGQMLPQINYETFGAGFARLPAELGGQVQGAQGNRMSGKPME